MDKSGSLLVIELKRTEDAGHSELQALRYAAMVSPMTFEQAAETYRNYLAKRSLDAVNAESKLRDFIEGADGHLSGQVRIVLVAADFSQEVTTSVLWLNSQGLDITCVRMKPYGRIVGEQLTVDVHQLIPLPEAADFQVAIQQQALERRTAERAQRDFTKYNLVTSHGKFDMLGKRHFILNVVKEAYAQQLSPAQILACVPWRKNDIFLSAEGSLSSQELQALLAPERRARYFTLEEDLLRHVGRTYSLTNQWGNRTEEAVKAIVAACPKPSDISYQAVARV